MCANFQEHTGLKKTAKIAAGILAGVLLASLFAGTLAPAHYAKQFRDDPSLGPSSKFLLGTDELGRDRFSRLLYGTRVSLLLAPCAALLSTFLAALIGGLAGYFGGRLERLAMLFTDLFMSMPWLFLLITVRAVLPLNTPPTTSVLITFSLLGLLGWAASARLVCSGIKNLRNSEFILQAKAAGCRASRLFAVHMLPNMKPILYAQFWISIPVFILAEANLGILGLGVSEPLPSWGSLLRELEDLSGIGLQPWRLVPLFLLLAVVSCFQIVISEKEYSR
jgi:peptide/nickel transport system permease protein